MQKSDRTASKVMGDPSNLRQASRFGVVINIGSQAVRLFLVFANQIILARLLTPDDFGLVAMAGPILTLALLLSDFGLTNATIQRKDLSHADLNFIFWTNLAASWILGIIIVILAPVVGWFYNDARVTDISAALAGVLFLSGLSAQHLALLNRRMAFGWLATIDLISYFGGALIGLLLAWYGFGYWSLVAIGISSALFTLLISWSVTDWLPSKPAMINTGMDLVRFGGNMSGFNLSNYISRNLDNIIVGRFSGVTQLGYYDRAYKLLLLPIQQVNTPLATVALPMLSQLHHDDSAYRRSYLRLLQCAMILTYPSIIFGGINSDAFVEVLLGPQWGDVAPIFSLLAISAIFFGIGNSSGWLFVSQDRTREMRNCSIAAAAFFSCAFLIGVRWGAVGVAGCYALATTIQSPALMWVATRRGPVSFSDLCRAVAPLAFATIITVLAALGLRHILPRNALGLVGALSASQLLFILALCVLPSGRSIVTSLWFHVLGLRNGR